MSQKQSSPSECNQFQQETIQHASVGISLPDGSEVEIPITRIYGRDPQPRVVMVAGVHGDELVGPHALVELAQELTPSALRGTVVLVPSANPLAFAAGRRKAPQDDLDLNRIFPGKSDGTATDRIAAALTNAVIGTADLVVDLHSAGREGTLVPLSGFREAHADCARQSALAAAAFGLEYYWMMRWSPGTLSTWANQQGIPAVGCEVGGRAEATREQIDLYKDGLRRCLRYLGMLDPPLEVALPPKVWTQEHLLAPCGGLLENLVRLGQEVESGETLARVRDLWGRICGAITAPRNGTVLHIRVQQSVATGDNVFWLGQLEDNPCYSST
jgi:predicted deacylase